MPSGEVVTSMAKQETKNTYIKVCGCLLGLTAGMWALVYNAIRVTEGTSNYWGGACACDCMLSISLVCALRIYFNIMDITEQNKFNFGNMVDCLSSALALTILSSFAGIFVTSVMGLATYCSKSMFNDDECVNKEENKDIAIALVVGCAVTLIVSIRILCANLNTKMTFKLETVPSQNYGHGVVAVGTLQINPNTNQEQIQVHNYPVAQYSQQPNPSPVPQYSRPNPSPVPQYSHPISIAQYSRPNPSPVPQYPRPNPSPIPQYSHPSPQYSHPNSSPGPQYSQPNPMPSPNQHLFQPVSPPPTYLSAISERGYNSPPAAFPNKHS